MASPRLAPVHRQLVENHLPLVRAIARALRHDLVLCAELADLEGCGYEALLGAATRFEPGRGAAFTTFATPRIRGAMLDAVRARYPGGWPACIDDAPDRVSDDADAEQVTLAREAYERLHRALKALPRRERHVLRQVYFEDKQLMDVGAVLGMSKWSATRLHLRAVKHLRQALEELR